MPGFQRLMEIIAHENPYSNGHEDEMDFDLLAPTGNPGTATYDFSRLDVEMTNYGGTWDFKSVPQPISRALRVKYRYRVPLLHLTHHPHGHPDSHRWRTDYLLIGFVNGGAG
jgi:hypothetical protein